MPKVKKINPNEYASQTWIAKELDVPRSSLRTALKFDKIEKVNCGDGSVLVNIASAREWKDEHYKARSATETVEADG